MKSAKVPLYQNSTKKLWSSQLEKVYQDLLKHFGFQHWWPGKTDFEIIVGAILTQNTSWTQVEKAIENLRSHRVLDPVSMFELPHSKIASLIRPAGYFNVKAVRIKAFLDFLFQSYRGSLKVMFQTPMPELRSKLLSVNGIGPETADCILLYAGRMPSFVIDAYTRRIFARHRLSFSGKSEWSLTEKRSLSLSYQDWQKAFTDALPLKERLFNDFHAQIVMLGKYYCKASNPLCSICPLRSYL